MRMSDMMSVFFSTSPVGSTRERVATDAKTVMMTMNATTTGFPIIFILGMVLTLSSPRTSGFPYLKVSWKKFRRRQRRMSGRGRCSPGGMKEKMRRLAHPLAAPLGREVES